MKTLSDHKINPERITKPIQLLGAWLAGLFSIDSCFLFAAANMAEGSWEARALIVAAIINVPIFLLAVFLLQTKFRPELQEDSYYSTYLSQKTNEPITINKHEARLIEIVKKIEHIEDHILKQPTLSAPDSVKLKSLLFGVNKHLSDITNIKETLAELGLFQITTFGTDEAPGYRVAAISQHIHRDIVNEVLNLLSRLGFEGYQFFDNEAEYTKEDILLGSYGEPEYEILKIQGA